MSCKNNICEDEQKNAIQAELGGRTYLPLGLDLEGVRCLVVGGGRIASRKINTLVNAGASVTVVSPEIAAELTVMANDGRIAWINSKYEEALLGDSDIVISATSDKKLNIKIGRDAKSRDRLSCVASSAKDSNLIFPAVYSHGGITVAVHSNGKNCLKSKYTKNRIADFLGGNDEKQLLLAGIDYNNVPCDVSKALDAFTKRFKGDFKTAEIAFISTCQRWECYIYDAAPNRVLREIIERIEKQTNIGISRLADCLYSKSGAAAFHHLIRLCAGLDSNLLGETEIAAQINSAMNNRLDEDTALRSVFELAMSKSNKIRAGFDSSGEKVSWANAVAEFLSRRNHQSEKVKITVSGGGRFAERIYLNLQNEYDNIQFGNDFSDCGILILCRELLPQEALSIKCGDKKKTVLDLTRYNSSIADAADIEYFSLNDITGAAITVDAAVNKAIAEKKAIEQTLIWHSSVSNIQIPREPVKIGARSSRLSILQVEEVLSLLTILDPDFKFSVEHFGSPGDRDKITPLPKITDGDFFSRDLDNALTSYRIDLAVHSAKDLPQTLPQGLCVAAITPPLAVWDCLVSRGGLKLVNLPAGAWVGTSSARRAARILSLRPDIEIADIRGDVPNRIGQLDAGRYDAIVLASVGLIRLGLSGRIAEIFPESVFPIEPGQGSLALVTRKSDCAINEFLKPLDLASRRGC